MSIVMVNNELGMGGLQRITVIILKALPQNHEVLFYSLKKKFIEGEYLLFKDSLLKEIWKSIRILEQINRRGKYTPYKNVKNKVVFYGYLKNDDLTKHYLNSSMYTITSRWKGFSLAVVEAMSFGLPIISFGDTGSSELLDQGKYGKLVKNGNVGKIIDELNLFIDKEKLRFEFQKKSLERVKDFYIERIISDWEKVLLEVQDE